MAKGKHARLEAKEPILSTREKKSTGDSGGTRSPYSPKPPCWKFQLSEITSAGRQAAKGTRVNGVIRGARVAVLGGAALGLAPAAVSQKMISAVSSAGRALAGQVLSNRQSGSIVEVQLCLT
jgi:hypothetical protein